MEELLLPAIQPDEKYSPKQNRRKSYDVPKRCTTSFHQNCNSEANFTASVRLPCTIESTTELPTATFRRWHSSPSIFTYIREAPSAEEFDEQSHDAHYTPSIVKRAVIGVVSYISVGVLVYMTKVGSFKGNSTFQLVDALYFTIVSLCTTGYGDIVPCTNFTKIFTCLYILVGFGFVDILLNGLVTYVLDKQEAVLLSTMDENKLNATFHTYMINGKKRRTRVRMKVLLALWVVAGSITIGTIMVHTVEGLNWIDSFYLSVISVTTVGYGDYGFSTTVGRLFAALWLLVSTFAVARAFLFLTELRMERRNRRTTKWILRKKMTANDLVAADLDNDGAISKSDFVIYKLKEMGKITEEDFTVISDQFDELDRGKCGKITLADIIGSEI